MLVIIYFELFFIYLKFTRSAFLVVFGCFEFKILRMKKKKKRIEIDNLSQPYFKSWVGNTNRVTNPTNSKNMSWRSNPTRLRI